jgi:protein-S-isoprenylcysteine O-methyltransferase Ste14
MTSAAVDTPAVRFPPPLVFALAVAGGWLANRYLPLPIAHGRIRDAFCGAFFLLGAALAVATFSCFLRARTSPLPFRPATALVTSGPFTLTRNPIYASMALTTIGCGLLLGTWWPIGLLVPAVVMIDRFVIVPEERYLRRRFGAAFEDYERRVRRWL